jgi:hypothetical protein
MLRGDSPLAASIGRPDDARQDVKPAPARRNNRIGWLLTPAIACEPCVAAIYSDLEIVAGIARAQEK